MNTDIIRFRTGFNVRTKQDLEDKKEKAHLRHGSTNVNLDTPAEGSATTQASGEEVTKEKSTEDVVTGTKEGEKEKEKEDELDSDMLEPGIVPKGGGILCYNVVSCMLIFGSAEQFDQGDTKKIYKNLQPVGRGGFGSVFIAKSSMDKADVCIHVSGEEDLILGLQVAIKKIAHVTKKAKRTNFNEIGFLNFCKHPNIVKYYRSHLVEEEVWVCYHCNSGHFLILIRLSWNICLVVLYQKQWKDIHLLRLVLPM